MYLTKHRILLFLIPNLIFREKCCLLFLGIFSTFVINAPKMTQIRETRLKFKLRVKFCIHLRFISNHRTLLASFPTPQKMWNNIPPPPSLPPSSPISDTGNSVGANIFPLITCQETEALLWRRGGGPGGGGPSPPPPDLIRIVFISNTLRLHPKAEMLSKFWRLSHSCKDSTL